MQALERLPPRAAGGRRGDAVSVSDALHASAGLETPITCKCLVGGKYFHGASKLHLVCRRFHTGSARLGMELNEGATHSQAWLLGHWQALLIRLELITLKACACSLDLFPSLCLSVVAVGLAAVAETHFRNISMDSEPKKSETSHFPSGSCCASVASLRPSERRRLRNTVLAPATKERPSFRGLLCCQRALPAPAAFLWTLMHRWSVWWLFFSPSPPY